MTYRLTNEATGALLLETASRRSAVLQAARMTGRGAADDFAARLTGPGLPERRYARVYARRNPTWRYRVRCPRGGDGCETWMHPAGAGLCRACWRKHGISDAQRERLAALGRARKGQPQRGRRAAP